MRGAYPVTVRDRRKTLYGVPSRRPDGSVSASHSCGYSVNKLRRYMLKDYHKF
jgi:hypothetical protein